VPYSIRKGGGSCKPGQYAVVKTATGESVGCHADQASAKKQLAALYANVKESVEPGYHYTHGEREDDVQLRETAVISERAAAAAKATGKMLVQFIDPGWGTSGYYSPDVLAEAAANRVIPAGTHMYADHPTADERNTRPERSIRDLMAVTTSDAQVAANGGLVGEVRVMAPYQELITDLKDHIGVSIWGDATDVSEGTAEGRRGRIIEGIEKVSSVDFVTRPGRGGQVLQLLESARQVDDEMVTVVPDSWLADGIHVELAEALEEVATSAAGVSGTEKLHAYWRHGEGAAKIRWGVAGDFQRCVDHLAKYVRDPKGYCAKMHKDVTGFTPGHAPGESHESAVEERAFSSGQRDKMADKGHAMSDGSFPIANTSDLKNAIQALGRAKNPDAAKRHIIKRARELNALGSLPDSWGVKESDVPATRPDSTTTIEETTEVTMGKIQIEEAEHIRLVEEAGRVDTLASERDTEKARAELAETRLAEAEAKIAEAAPKDEGGAKATPSRNPRQLIESQLAEQKHEIAVLNAREKARDIVGEELAEAWVAPSTVARLSSDLLADLPLVEGKLDETGLRNRCVEARNRAELEAAETLDAAGFGTPRGMGAMTTPAGGTTEKYTDNIAEGLQVFGLSESAAKSAAKGR
jgi:hypothetical protein